MNDEIENVNVSEPMNAGSEGLPSKLSPWTKMKNFLFQEITVTMTPKQAKVLGEVRDFWCQDITGAAFKDLMLSEVTLKSMKDFWFQKIEF